MNTMRDRAQVQKEFNEVDDALYLHESPYYSQAARGFPIHDFTRDHDWHAKRAELTVKYHRLYAELYPERAQAPEKESATQAILGTVGVVILLAIICGVIYFM